MELNSDGSNDDKNKNLEKSLFMSINNGSSDTGTIDISQDEINKIIGIDMQENQKQVKTPKQKNIEKKVNNNPTKNDMSTGLPVESFSTTDAITRDSIFKARSSVSRTPPQSAMTSNQNNVANYDNNTEFSEETVHFMNTNSQKRNRSDSSPAALERSKIKKLNPESSPLPNSDNCPNKSCSKNIHSTEAILNEILDALQRIH